MSLSNRTEQSSKRRMKSDPVMICPHFLYSSCLKGNSCEYAHDKSPDYVHPKDVECELFRKGKCKHGKNCWFRHQCERDKKDSKSSHDKYSESTNVTRPSSNVKNSAATSVQTAPKIKNRISFWHENSKRWQNRITKYPSTLTSNSEKVGYKHVASRMEKCSHFTTGICPNEKCIYFHGLLCEYCHKYCVHPLDEDEQLKHIKECSRRCTRGSDCSVCHKKESEKKLHLDRQFVKANRQKR